MVRTTSTLTPNHIHQHSLAVRAKSGVTVPSRSVSTVRGVRRMKSALTMLYQSAVGPIRPKERVFLEQGKRPMEDLLQGAGVAVPRELTRQAVNLTALRDGHVPPPNPPYSILLKIWISLSIHSNMTTAFTHWILSLKSWKTWQDSVRPPLMIIGTGRCSRLTLRVPDKLWADPFLPFCHS